MIFNIEMKIFLAALLLRISTLQLATQTSFFTLKNQTCLTGVICSTDNCSTFQFRSCLICTAKYANGQCSNYQSNGAWQQCTNNCCEPGKSYPQTMASINACLGYNQKQSKIKLIIIIVCSIIGGGCLIFHIVLCIVKRRQICKNFFHFKQQKVPRIYKSGRQKRTGNLTTDSTRLNKLQLLQKNGYKQSFCEEISWQKVQADKLIYQTICAVCLDKGCSMELICGHAFHRACIVSCLKAKKQCILCRNTKMFWAQVFCEGCSLYCSFQEIDRGIENLLIQQQLCALCRVQRKIKLKKQLRQQFL